MKKHFLILLMLTISKFGISQKRDSSFYKSGVPSLYGIISKSIKENPLLKSSNTLCITSCTFFKFVVVNKKIISIKVSRSTPEVFTTSVRKALYQTDGSWPDMDTTVYLLPFIYVFESGCRPSVRSTDSILRILTDISEDPDRAIRIGGLNEKPLKCTILNPYLYQSEYFGTDW